MLTYFISSPPRDLEKHWTKANISTTAVKYAGVISVKATAQLQQIDREYRKNGMCRMGGMGTTLAVSWGEGTGWH